MTGREAGGAGPTIATATTTATATATTTTTMSRSVLQPSQQKLAEKLTILNDRGVGMLTRLYNIKKVRTGRRGLGGGGMEGSGGLSSGGGGRRPGQEARPRGRRPHRGRRDAPRPNAEPWRLSRRLAGRPGAERSHLPAPSTGNWPARRGVRDAAAAAAPSSAPRPPELGLREREEDG